VELDPGPGQLRRPPLGPQRCGELPSAHPEGMTGPGLARNWPKLITAISMATAPMVMTAISAVLCHSLRSWPPMARTGGMTSPIRAPAANPPRWA